MNRDETVNNREDLITQDGQKHRIIKLFVHNQNIKKKVVGDVHYNRVFHLAEKLFNETTESDCTSHKNCESGNDSESEEDDHDAKLV